MIRLDVAKPSVLKPFLGRHGFSFKKGLGQNFLIDGRILTEIVDACEITEEDGVLEIGPGAGVVTQLLADRAKVVVAVEKDRSLEPVLAESLEGLSNVEVVFADVLQVDLALLWDKFQTCKRVSVVANLPYYVTTPILFHVLDAQVQVHNIVVMVQREVAERLNAKPGTKDYGALTVTVQYRAQVGTVVQVSRGAFMPPPTVDSTVVRMRCRTTPAVPVKDEEMFFRVIRAAFGMRRKTLLNALSAQLSLGKDVVTECLQTAGVDSMRRGETLSIEEFARLADEMVLHRNP
jgi:16S rRNA (adenine1518-N6/adenine1519-N6)-dimethyltransferase